MHRSWFYRTLMSYIPIFLLIIFSLSLLFFYLMNSQSKKQAVHADEMVSEKIMQIIDFSLKNIDQAVTSEALNNNTMIDFFNERTINNTFLNFQTIKVLQKLKSMHPLIDSIYLVNRNSDYVLSTNTNEALEMYEDKRFIQRAIDESHFFQWSGQRNFREFSSQPNRSVVTLVRNVELIGNQKGLFVVNVSVDALRQLIQGVYKPGSSFMRFLDRDGIPLFMRDNGVQVMNATRSSYTGWSIETGLSGGWADVYSIINLTWLVCGLIIVGLGTLWIVHVTRKHSRPIERLVSLIQLNPISRFTFSKDKNEILFIEKALDELTSKSIQLQEQQQLDLELKRYHFFHEWIAGNHPIDEDQIKSGMMRLGIPVMSFHHVQVVVIEINSFYDFSRMYTLKEQALLKYVVTNAFKETAENCGLKVCMEWTSENQLTSVFQVMEPTSQSLTEYACGRIIDWIAGHTTFTITAAIGEIGMTVREVPRSFQEALYCLRLKMILGGNQVLAYREIGAAPSGEIFVHLENLKHFVQAFLMEKNWQTAVEDWFNGIREHKLGRDDISSLVNYLIFHLDQQFNSMAHEYSKIWKLQTMNRLEESLKRFDDLRVLQISFCSILSELALGIESLREQRGNVEMVQQMKEYIECCYTNPNLSLSTLSERFTLNEKYVSKLFKEESGHNFIDFLTENRIVAARQLLIDTDNSIEAISEKVGYANSVSFRRSFKKVMGISPGDYRRTQQTVS